MRQVTIDLSELLSLIHCAEDYGYAKSVFLSSMGELIKYVTDEDIEAYAQTLLSRRMRSQGYDEEDYESAVDTLTEWRDKYCGNEPND